ncbi:MAG: hypothetical protein A2W90_21880 [Bacteroidetes bacterium GWF2_42_66]|nr:MAG: hypothetical protein A2W92_04695 [Bacteroidetes bacterium GWA2_42_15]OFY03259.1 MAG: hypothetical protein A2W89_18980 [Bacteroidetes bacterium GWE2_42_39]OFY45691.1 MAG: hypothetical protein A2W90_21880 [Bacteroidetes bacterium GWF2_42_66]HBL77321.1 hypothetical protein [Prolixibacteraceae bacterium]HCR91934.1 hypothetical protein [Prolixibacteraceae bacterium]
MEGPLLKEQSVFPSEEILGNVLGDSFPVFTELMESVTKSACGLTSQWNYYNDGKAWLCKMQYKKKTVFWLSVWDGFFKTAFYFTEKTGAGLMELDIKESLKQSFNSAKSFGKLIPLVFTMRTKDQLEDLLKVIEYKKSLK